MSAYDWPQFKFGGTTTHRNPDKDRSLPGKKRRRAVRKARRTEANLYRKPAEPKPVHRQHGLLALEDKFLADLRWIAGQWEIPGRSKMNKADLVEAIYRHPNNRA